MSGGNKTRWNRETWERVVAQYRLMPGDHAKVAKAAGVDPRTCKKAWEIGLSYLEVAQKPIRQVLEELQAATRRVLAEEGVRAQAAEAVQVPAMAAGAEEVSRGAPEEPPSRLEEGRRLRREAQVQAARVRANEAKLVGVTRSNALLLAARSNQMIAGLGRLAVRLFGDPDEGVVGAIEERFFRPVEGQEGKLQPLTLDEIDGAMRVLERVATFTARTGQLASHAMEIERLLKGAPPTTEADTMTREEALAELSEGLGTLMRAADNGDKRAKEAIAAGGRLKLVVLEGGAGKKRPGIPAPPKSRAGEGPDEDAEDED